MKRRLFNARRAVLSALAIVLSAQSGLLPVSAGEEILIGIEAETQPPQASSSDSLAGFQSGDHSAQGTAEGQVVSEEEEWCLILVNRTHPIPDDYVIPSLTRLAGGHQVDSRIYPALQQMFDDARAQGIYPSITSSFRTMEDQQAQMDSKISEYEASGYSQQEAKALAEEWVAIPGTSEHQLGLCVDISADVASGQDPGTVWYWLLENSYRYGFVKRYPEDKTEITGIINEPWHFRYVGVNAATQMTQQGLCLEEYLGQLSAE